MPMHAGGADYYEEFFSFMPYYFIWSDLFEMHNRLVFSQILYVSRYSLFKYAGIYVLLIPLCMILDGLIYVEIYFIRLSALS